MITALIISQILSWLLIIGLIVALLAVARQVGVLHERVAPVGALTPKQGPEVGSPAPRILARTLEGGYISLGDDLSAGTRQMIFFVSAQCPICKKLIPYAKSFAKAEGVDLIFAGDDTIEVQRKLIASQDIEKYPFINDGQVGRAFAVDKLPHAVLLAPDGTILSRGLVNSREHLESMIVSAETGVHSIQEYLQTRMEERA